jgi:hypothetical protein
MLRDVAQASILIGCRFGTKTIIVRAGQPGITQDFAVYEKLVRQSSIFMNNALKEPWKESTDRVVCLPDFRGEAFDVYHLWLLTGNLHNKVKRSHGVDFADGSRMLYYELLDLATLSHLGHYLLDTAFTDTVCDVILQCCQDLQSIGIAYPMEYGSRIYKLLPERSPTRSLIANVVAWTTTYRGIESFNNEHSDTTHADYPLDVLQAMAKRFLSPGTSTSPLVEPK